MYLFDTDTLSSLLRPRPIETAQVRFAQTPTGDRFTSTINAAELLYGARRLREIERRERLIANIRSLLSGLIVLPFDHAAADIYASVRSDLERQGTPLDMADLMIAAVALAHDLIVVTGNIGHFSRVPALQLENWL